MQLIHCRNNFLRELAYKSLDGDIGQERLVRMRSNPVHDGNDLMALIDAYKTRSGLYVSVYSYERLVKPGDKKTNGEPYNEKDIGKAIYYQSAKINRIYLDFDDKDDPQKEFDEAILVSRILLRHKIYSH